MGLAALGLGTLLGGVLPRFFTMLPPDGTTVLTPLAVPIAAVLIIQGAVAAGQFLAQRDLGLVPLGELPLHPAHEGNSVLLARGQPWLRAYGLTIHPNLLGALLAALLLLALPMARRERGAERSAVLLALVVGGAGLFLSFSRASWLGFAAGLGTVSYTHLDVYKRQSDSRGRGPGSLARPTGAPRQWAAAGSGLQPGG